MMGSPGGFSGPVNLGNPHEITIIELAKHILRLTGSRSKLEYSNLPQDYILQRSPYIHLAYEALQWEPKVNLEDGLKETIEHFKTR